MLSPSCTLSGSYYRLMVQLAPDYDHLTVMQKVEIFTHALENTSGTDLARVMWLKSRNSEVRPRSRTRRAVVSYNLSCAVP
jgi:phosphatidylinositol kinase/protein kinase (PI-3  family)